MATLYRFQNLPIPARRHEESSRSPPRSDDISPSFSSMDLHSPRTRHLHTIPESHGRSSGESSEEHDRMTESQNTQGSMSPSPSQYLNGNGGVPNQDREYNMKRILRLRSFEMLIESRDGRDFFRNWLKSKHNVSVTDDSGSGSQRSGLIKLDRWTDELKTEALLTKLRDQSKSVHDLYYRKLPEVQLHLMPEQAHRPSLNALQEMANLATELTSSRSWLLRSLYTDEFQRFIINMLVRLTSSRLERELSSHMGWLGEAFVLTNPRVNDNPIVMASPGFISMTGYKLEECIGRNFRMLSGSGTSASARQRIKHALDNLRPCMELLINYRKDNSPFFCLLNIIPLFDAHGEVTYFFAGQVDVTSELQSPDLTSFLSKIDSHTFSPRTRSKKAPRPVVADSPLMQSFQAGESLGLILNNSQEEVLSYEEDRNQTTFTDKKIMEITIGPINSKKKIIPWVSALNRKSPNSNKLNKSLDSFSTRSSNMESSQTSSSPNLYVSLLEMTYSRIIIFKRPSLDIIFATPGALMFLGLPVRTEREMNMSELLHMKITDLLSRATSKLTKGLRSAVCEAVKRGELVSCSCLLSYDKNPKSNDGSSKAQNSTITTDPTMIHLTPLMDPKGGISAYVAVLAA